MKRTNHVVTRHATQHHQKFIRIELIEIKRQFTMDNIEVENYRNMKMFLSDKRSTLETLDFTFYIGSTPTFLYFDLYLNTAYAAHYVYFTTRLKISYWRCYLISPLNKTIILLYFGFISCFVLGASISFMIHGTIFNTT